MCQCRYYAFIVVIGLLFSSSISADVRFEPGAGIGFEYTDNARLAPDSAEEDLISVAYVGARVSENEGPLKYNAATSFNKSHYLNDTFEDQRYFNLAARVDWEMIRDRFGWFLSDNFSQRSVISSNANTPSNLQDSNVFTFGANIQLLKSPRHSFSLVPTFSQYYFEVLSTDNKQYSLAANWNYQMFRLTNVGLNVSARKINYTKSDIFGRSIDDTTFTSYGFTFNSQQRRSNFSGSLGATNVKRDNGGETTGFSGFVNWLADVSSRSKFETILSTDLTDASSVAATDAGGDVQITADVIRNTVASVAYIRDDASLNTRVFARYHEITYSDNPLDRIVRAFGISANYPMTQLLTSGAYLRYNRTQQIDIVRLDESYTVGGNLKYRFTREWAGLIDLKYRVKESSVSSQNYNETSVFVSLVYGFGSVQRPSRAGGS